MRFALQLATSTLFCIFSFTSSAETWGWQNKHEELAKELEVMGAEDQKHRAKLQEEFVRQSKEGKSEFSPETLKLIEQQAEIDKKNMERLAQIVEKFGWPGKSLVGEKGATAAFLIVQHAELVHQEKYLPILKTAAEKGEARASEVAMLEDRVLMRQGKPQIYGTQLKSDPATQGKLVLHPIDNEADVDERRKRVGLPPLKDYLKLFGLEYELPKK